MKNSFTTLLSVGFVMLALGCSTTAPVKPEANKKKPPEPRETELSKVNRPDPLDDQSFAFAPAMDVYRKNLGELVGVLILAYPNPSGSNQFSARVIGRVLTESAKTNIVFQNFDQVRYKSKVEGKFAANLSFMIGKAGIASTNLYDLTLTDSSGAISSFDEANIDATKLTSAADQIPDKFKAVLYTTAVKHSVLATRDFTSVNVDADASYSIIKVDGHYFSSSENTELSHVMIATIMDLSRKFGTYDSATGLFTKKTGKIAVTDWQPAEHTPKQQVQELRKILRTDLADH